MEREPEGELGCAPRDAACGGAAERSAVDRRILRAHEGRGRGRVAASVRGRSRDALHLRHVHERVLERERHVPRVGRVAVVA